MNSSFFIQPLIFVSLVLTLGCAADYHSSTLQSSSSSRPEPEIPSYSPPVSYLREIQPIFDKRCVSCHSCYDAPAQLNLSCSDGLLRGATKQKVYDATRLVTADHTRLHVDAKTEEQWRNKGFFSILGDRQSPSIIERLKSSILYQMLAQSRLHTLPYSQSVKDLVQDSHEPAKAPDQEELSDYFKNYHHGGMPYFVQRLSNNEFNKIANWVAQGSPVESSDNTLSYDETESVKLWESFLNQPSLKAQLVSRYLYEHWFISHLYFESVPQSGNFKIVRSKTPPGQPISPIVTDLPNDNPGITRVYYRLVKLHTVIKRKTHIPYPLSPEKLSRIQDLFYSENWDLVTLPAYKSADRVNPFRVFTAIPAQSRYQFLLDNSYYFIQCFIKGPVCRGQNALNAIHDNFHILFQDPQSKLSMSDNTFLSQNQDNLKLPGNIRRLISFPVEYNLITAARSRYLKNQQKYLGSHFPVDSGVELTDIWHGDNSQSQPYLTVFRHFDTASVIRGIVGGTAETAWVLDFPLLERIYYSLVVNFDVFSTAGHQAATRRYFDLLRHEGENTFLSYLPLADRQAIQDSWYRGVMTKGLFDYHSPSQVISTQVKYLTDNPTSEFLKIFKTDSEEQQSAIAPHPLTKTIANLPSSLSPFVTYFPELIFVRILKKDNKDEVFTVLRNKAHTNIAYIFGEESRRQPERDSLLILSGVTGDYPNVMLVINEEDLQKFKQELYAAKSKEHINKLIESYAILRNSSHFWDNLEWFQHYEEKKGPNHLGLFDLKNYFIY